jgi:dipeptidyl aminopeptidase/acylaminoacyl peptidase
LEHLFSSQPDLEQYEFVPKRAVDFAARDYEQLHGYLTEPAQFCRPGPLVLLVHGGTWGRDHGLFDSEVQWLADRGYACLQVNFRGSLGYGKRFFDLARREWGGRMQDDLTDAVGWAVQQGIAEPSRVAIMGMSYGGYAALASAALTRCVRGLTVASQPADPAGQ